MNSIKQAYRTPSFRVTDKDKNKIDTLIHCFMYEMALDISNPPATLTAPNKEVYTAVYDSIVYPKNTESVVIKVIVSFQKHTYGKFAVIRNFKEKV